MGTCASQYRIKRRKQQREKKIEEIKTSVASSVAHFEEHIKRIDIRIHHIQCRIEQFQEKQDRIGKANNMSPTARRSGVIRCVKQLRRLRVKLQNEEHKRENFVSQTEAVQEYLEHAEDASVQHAAGDSLRGLLKSSNFDELMEAHKQKIETLKEINKENRENHQTESKLSDQDAYDQVEVAKTATANDVIADDFDKEITTLLDQYNDHIRLGDGAPYMEVDEETFDGLSKDDESTREDATLTKRTIPKNAHTRSSTAANSSNNLKNEHAVTNPRKGIRKETGIVPSAATPDTVSISA